MELINKVLFSEQHNTTTNGMTKIGEAIFVREFRTKLNIFLALQVKRSH